MRKILSFMHVSLDGYVAGPNGEMDWIKLDDKLFDYVGERTNTVDLALYGKNTFDMMESYWPTAADKPNATKHDKEHSAWYKKVNKLVASTTLQSNDPLVTVLGTDLPQRLREIKNQEGSEIIMFGSPGLVHSLLEYELIDAFWLFINPVLIGKGIPMFEGLKHITQLQLIKTDIFQKSGVVCLNYEKI
ncbi:dihydrofolate reductase [Chitinophaga silvatica]|uniref:Dihydrofolate reductase n=1 Tax=Chitinophaga silvatica TaxID=2282649 RepID=A0A3E1Y3U6_9BACT|nr:dihydrofolate reductase family protein [Chitinophaga silvatica]RFS19348.1 dihydrofolate reductase [Chitinophaga silvatica]